MLSFEKNKKLTNQPNKNSVCPSPEIITMFAAHTNTHTHRDAEIFERAKKNSQFPSDKKNEPFVILR